MNLKNVEKLEKNSYLNNKDLYASVHVGDSIREMISFK